MNLKLLWKRTKPFQRTPLCKVDNNLIIIYK
jgi:hypothetical protein